MEVIVYVRPLYHAGQRSPVAADRRAAEGAQRPECLSVPAITSTE